MSAIENNCTLLLYHEGASGQQAELQKKLENKDDAKKIEGLKELILCMLNGEAYPKLMMSVIKFCLHSENHLIKKLLLLYWEVVERKDKNGKLLPEMILVCNAIKNNLNNANEYIRGSTLRFLTKMKEQEILINLIPPITKNLEHRHSYVRKYAVLAIFVIYENFPDLIPNAPELIENLLHSEANELAKRNAFLMLYHCDQDRAVNYLAGVINTIGSIGESFQLIVMELIRKVCRDNPLAKSQYIKCIYTLINCPSNVVAYEGANTLVSLSNAPTAVTAAVTSYCQLLASESDNNIKMIILNRLGQLKRRNEKILQQMLMDILRTLSSPSIDIRRKTLELALDLISPSNVEEVMQLLKKEIIKTEGTPNKQDTYRKLLVDTMHQCAIKFPSVVSNVVNLLMNYLSDDNASSALEVIYFVREVAEEYPKLTESILAGLLDNFNEIQSAQVFRVALWILGEYSTDSIIEKALQKIRSAIGKLPSAQKSNVGDGEEQEENDKSQFSSTPRIQPVVLADGTYATQASADGSKNKSSSLDTTSNLRSLIVAGDYFLAASLTSCITKLSLRFTNIKGFGTRETNQNNAKMMLLIVSILRLGTQKGAEKQIDQDSYQRMMLCMRVLLNPSDSGDLFMNRCRVAFANMLREQRKKKAKEEKKQTAKVVKQADDLITIRQFKSRAGLDVSAFDDDEADLDKAVRTIDTDKKSSQLQRVYRLTGFADPVYVEASLMVLGYDIVLGIMVVNQTKSMLQNLQVELNASGDLKVVENPEKFTIPPFGIQKMEANIKVTSTDSGVIFGNVVYDSANGVDKTIVVMDNIHMDVMDYILPANCSDIDFRSMWEEFEWENKVAVNTEIEDLVEYLNHVTSITNMRCMTSQDTMSGTCNFLAANLYARSMFGEDALLNLSVEKQDNGKIGGYIRIRSKTQGIALSLGNKITAKQRGNKKTSNNGQQ